MKLFLLAFACMAKKWVKIVKNPMLAAMLQQGRSAGSIKDRFRILDGNKVISKSLLLGKALAKIAIDEAAETARRRSPPRRNIRRPFRASFAGNFRRCQGQIRVGDDIEFTGSYVHQWCRRVENASLLIVIKI
jgi:hypothetical protein